jgi:hypothetical protein
MLSGAVIPVSQNRRREPMDLPLDPRLVGWRGTSPNRRIFTRKSGSHTHRRRKQIRILGPAGKKPSWSALEEVRFAHDSPLEGDGFERSVRPKAGCLLET